MGPLLFEPYAKHVAERLIALRPARILETAAGTGIVTRAVNEVLPNARILATDINPAIVEFASQHLRSEGVTFQRADAQQLPFEDESFDLVLCVFGVMFFPDKIRAHAEARRVLHIGGQYVVVTFDRLDLNPIPKAAGEAVTSVFPENPRYMERGPFSYTDAALVERDLRAAGFEDVRVETVQLASRVTTQEAARGIVLGSPFRAEIERLDSSALDRALTAVTEALLPWDGKDATMSAHISTAIR
jgi:ubiquinone/menaquinone biosynthesis C-methylase UbiE